MASGDSFPGSQTSSLDDEELDTMDRNACPENTAKNTKWAFKKLNDWMRKRNVNVDLKTVSGDDLAPILRRFYGELKSGNGKLLTPSSLVCIRSGIQRALLETRESPINIVTDPTFAKANMTFVSKCKLYAKLGNPKPKRKEEIAPGDLEKIKEYISDASTMTDPRRLTQAVWFLLAFNLGCRGRELYRQLRKDSLTFAVDDLGQGYFKITQSVVEKNHDGGPSTEAQWNNSTRIYDCQVGQYGLIEILQLYLSKLHQGCPWLFQQSRMNPNPADECWFKNEPLGVNSIGKMMPMISEGAGLSVKYTNHCVRATTITILFNAGVSVQNIQSRTGHRSVSGLEPYIGQSTTSHKRTESAILEAALTNNPDAAGGQQLGGSVTVRREVTLSAAEQNYAQVEQLQMNTYRSAPDDHMKGVLHGTFSHCNINVTVNQCPPKE